MMGNRIILTDDDIIKLNNIVDDSDIELKRKLNAIVNIIKLEREYRENVNNINNEYFKDIEKEDK